MLIFMTSKISLLYAGIIHLIILSFTVLRLYNSACKVCGGDVNLHLKFNAGACEGFKSRLNLKDGSSRELRASFKCR